MMLLVVAASFGVLSIAGCGRSAPGDSAGSQWDSNPDLDGDSFHAGADCDDGNDAVHPGAEEVCDGIDNDCDWTIDVGVDVTIWSDGDGDGFGAGAPSDSGCDVPTGWVLEDGDCDDKRRNVNPDAPEVCDPDNVDEDCDAVADDEDASAGNLGLFYVDADGDGFGVDDSTPVVGCELPPGHAPLRGDCDDTRADVSPATIEVCGDAVDDDCDGFSSCALDGNLSDLDADVTITGAASGELLGGPPPLPGGIAPAGDVDGDGLGDLVVSASYERGAFLFLGPLTTSTSESAVARITYADSKWGAASNEPLSIADQDGDGYDDLVFWSHSAPSYPWYSRSYVFLGPLEGVLAAEADADATIDGNDDDFLGLWSSAGDVNGDGVVDALLSAPLTGTSDEGAVHLFLGPMTNGAQTESDAHASFLAEKFVTILGTAVCADGDLDGDGTQDVLITGHRYDAGTGAAWVFLGPVSGERGVADADVEVRPGSAASSIGSQASASGDLDGDGTDDIALAAVSSHGRGEVFVLSGSTVTASSEIEVSSTNAHILPDPVAYPPGWYLGSQIETGRDIDGDGFDDLVVSDSSTTVGGTVWGFTGPVSGTLTVSADAAFVIGPTAAWSDYRFGNAVATLPDVTGDGFDDLAVSAPNFHTGEFGYPPGAVYVFAAGP